MSRQYYVPGEADGGAFPALVVLWTAAVAVFGPPGATGPAVLFLAVLGVSYWLSGRED